MALTSYTAVQVKCLQISMTVISLFGKGDGGSGLINVTQGIIISNTHRFIYHGRSCEGQRTNSGQTCGRRLNK